MITDDTECWDTEELRVSSKAERSLVIMQIRSIRFFLATLSGIPIGNGDSWLAAEQHITNGESVVTADILCPHQYASTEEEKRRFS